MRWNRFLSASVTSCRIEEISASGLSLECRSLARRHWVELVGTCAAIRFHSFAYWAGSLCRFALYRWSPKMKKLVLLGALALSVLSLQAFADESL
jgi:hypothetical protein